MMKKRFKLGLLSILMSVSIGAVAQEKPNNKLIDKLCKNAEQSMEEVYENGALTQCHFPNSSLLSAYQEYRNLLGDDKKFLEAKLEPNKNKEVICSDNNCQSVIYRWSGDQKLEIEQSFPGGETYLQFIQNNKDTSLEIRYFPD
ncbi:hypothetical protein [Providencia alcalifaciens]|uniref:hypothetical protein n=1 Tax=Providencia alcalifaciens TaxID=126385 RepID=UPI001CC4E20E|nr:hypothetical protein [Providencia alcalifaciens]CAG9417930.1 hypothetical protein NVI2019_GHJFPKLH_01581 [Providencia alcalifaciens]